MRAHPVVMKALLTHLDPADAREAANMILDDLDDAGLRIVRGHTAPAAQSAHLRAVTGIGLFRLPSEPDSVTQDRSDG